MPCWKFCLPPHDYTSRVSHYQAWGHVKFSVRAILLLRKVLFSPLNHIQIHQVSPQLTTGQHPQHWIKTGIGSVLHQPSLQSVHRGQRSSFGGTPLNLNCPCITIWKPVPASTIQHIMPCTNLMEPLENYMSPSQMGEGAWRDLRPIPLVSR